MTSIREIVQNALSQKYLSVAAEDGLRELLEGKYDHEDFQAFMTLQRAFLDGKLTQESRENLLLSQDEQGDSVGATGADYGAGLFQGRGR
ncbi:MAG: hypothetical protein AAGF75_10720 [Cyanobacteria bacterium P01_H01_bin.130]